MASPAAAEDTPAIQPTASPGDRITRFLFHAICVPPKPADPEDAETYFRWRLAQAERFLRRFGRRLDIRNKTILDFGCGHGAMSFFLAQNGARRVVGVDTDKERIAFAQHKLQSEFSALQDKIRYLVELQAERFDLVLSEDCFEHYEDPERIMKLLRNYLTPEGRVIIGFSPLWKSPYGGHIGYMTRFPWAHLLFPERIIMLERRRYRPDESARTFAEMRGGLNKMTYAKFLRTMRASGYQIEYLASNVSDSRLMPSVNMLRRLPFCFEYFTKNLYAIVRPEPAPSFDSAAP